MIEAELILEPEKLLEACGIGGKQHVADFGCGPGIFSIPIARMTEGTVYCFDVLESALEAVTSRAQVMGLGNLVTRRVNLEKEKGSELKDGAIDHVIMRKILLQNEDKDALFREARRVLKEDGKLLIVGWSEKAIQGFGTNEKLSKETVKEIALRTGFDNPQELDAGEYHYALIFTK